MVVFKEFVMAKEDHLFVEQDVARLYRGLKNLLVEELHVDRIEEGHMEFSVEKPKDRVRMHAFKEKSPYTEIRYGLSLKCKDPRDLYKYDRQDDILKARIKIEAEIITAYPAGEEISWLPHGTSEWPDTSYAHSGVKAHEKKSYHRSKLYKLIVGIWYNVFYAREIDRYEEEAAESVLHLHNLLRDRFGVEKSIGRTGKSQYRPPWGER